MPNLEKYLSSRFAFSTNQTENLCKYCEKFVPKSLLQHYRYCVSKKEFDIKNGIEEDVLTVEETPLDIIIDEASLLETKEKTKVKKNKSNKK